MLPVVAFAVALATATVLTPIARRVACSLGCIDRPGWRKIHTNPTPRLGGLAIFAAAILGLFAAISASHGLSPLPASRSAGLAAAAMLVFLTGVVDDWKGLSAVPKLAAQGAAGVLLAATGSIPTEIVLPWNETILPGALGGPIVVAWVMLVTNAMNLIDGLDGLAAGLAAIGAATLGILSLLDGATASAIAGFAVAGAAVGFLGHNRPPARIFMGDSGSNFLGFALAAISLQAFETRPGAISALPAAAAIAVPLTDVGSTVVRRLAAHRRQLAGARLAPFVGAWRAVITSDRGHLHHRLLDRGLSHGSAALCLFAAAGWIALAGTATKLLATRGIWLAGTAMAAGITALLFAATPRTAARREAPGLVNPFSRRATQVLEGVAEETAADERDSKAA